VVTSRNKNPLIADGFSDVHSKADEQKKSSKKNCLQILNSVTKNATNLQLQSSTSLVKAFPSKWFSQSQW
jgi:hypothetical protein